MSKILTIYFICFIFPFQLFGQTSTRHYRSFNEFYKTLANNKGLKFTSLPLLDTSTTYNFIGTDSVLQSFVVTVESNKMQFIATRSVDNPFSYSEAGYILFNNQKIATDINISFEGLEILSAAKAAFKGTDLLVLSCWAPGCNGSFCRIKYDQIFMIKNRTVKTYFISDGWLQPENIYCDINSDGQLDMISFNGNCLSKDDSIETNNPEKYFFCIQAMTLKNKKWVAILDKSKKPYYINIQVDDFFELNNLKILEQNWFIKL